jgi:hypothetical protein
LPRNSGYYIDILLSELMNANQPAVYINGNTLLTRIEYLPIAIPENAAAPTRTCYELP